MKIFHGLKETVICSLMLLLGVSETVCGSSFHFDFFVMVACFQTSNYEKELGEMKHMIRQEYVVSLKKINQKIMKSAMIKDLYSEIDRLKQGHFVPLPATEGLRTYLEKLKNMCSCGIKALDDIAEELNSNSHSTFAHLKHSSASGNIFKGIASEAPPCLLTFKIVSTFRSLYMIVLKIL
ncbi:hypothetical protein M9H77_02496 [Catharanthus roseus]|uniref:Uncharacterized protein n=1 Tax=Catharanthus roseus TaxID=4058 RepID=A0ACC0C8Z9_CATRO|nr:hypothetical protein M9H77_02496 [Catharanthus roseus]